MLLSIILVFLCVLSVLCALSFAFPRCSLLIAASHPGAKKSIAIRSSLSDDLPDAAVDWAQVVVNAKEVNTMAKVEKTKKDTKKKPKKG